MRKGRRILARDKSVEVRGTRLTVMRREGVVCSIQAQDGHRRSGEFFIWTGVAVIVHTGLVTKLQSCEAFVKLSDRPRLEEKRREEERD